MEKCCVLCQTEERKFNHLIEDCEGNPFEWKRLCQEKYTWRWKIG